MPNPARKKTATARLFDILVKFLRSKLEKNVTRLQKLENALLTITRKSPTYFGRPK
jgi:hypothetical protein